MDKETLLKLAEKAGFCACPGKHMQKLEAFSELIAAHEREECAKECERMIDSGRWGWSYANLNVYQAAKSIRTRK